MIKNIEIQYSNDKEGFTYLKSLDKANILVTMGSDMEKLACIKNNIETIKDILLNHINMDYLCR